MQIKHVYIQEYRVLRNFTLEIDDPVSIVGEPLTYKIDLIVGVNGTGKSTFMRLLAELFQHLYLANQPPDFIFSITYTLQQHPGPPLTITISNRSEDKVNFRGNAEGIEQEKNYYLYVAEDDLSSLVESIDKRYLPDDIIAFSSGNQENWELSNQIGQENINLPLQTTAEKVNRAKLLELYTTEIDTIPTQEPDIIQTQTQENHFISIKNSHLPLVILCGLLADRLLDQSILNDALLETKIEALRGFSLSFIEGPESRATKDDQDFLQQLIELSTYTLQTGPKKLLFFELSTETKENERIKKLITLRDRQALELFKKLVQLQEPIEGTSKIVLSDVQLFFERVAPQPQQTDETPSLTKEDEQAPLQLLEWLSDGEISFLGRLSLFALLHNNEALILLDEPEVHFNDYWKHQLVNRIDHSMKGSHSHVIMTTHSSITLSDVIQTDIHVLKRNGSFTKYAVPPNVRTLGTDPSDIIMHVFGAESATGAYSTEYIEKEIRSIRQIRDPYERSQKFIVLARIIGPGPLRYQIYREQLAAEGDYTNEQEPKLRKE